MVNVLKEKKCIADESDFAAAHDKEEILRRQDELAPVAEETSEETSGGDSIHVRSEGEAATRKPRISSSSSRNSVLGAGQRWSGKRWSGEGILDKIELL